jgi:cytochrome c oxidase cbb3-type subunit 4
MPDLGILRGLITLITLVTFLGICWWAYRPENRARFEEDGWLAFGDEEPSLATVVADDKESDRATTRKVEESQA